MQQHVPFNLQTSVTEYTEVLLRPQVEQSCGKGEGVVLLTGPSRKGRIFLYLHILKESRMCNWWNVVIETGAIKIKCDGLRVLQMVYLNRTS